MLKDDLPLARSLVPNGLIDLSLELDVLVKAILSSGVLDIGMDLCTWGHELGPVWVWLKWESVTVYNMLVMKAHVIP